MLSVPARARRVAVGAANRQRADIENCLLIDLRSTAKCGRGVVTSLQRRKWKPCVSPRYIAKGQNGQKPTVSAGRRARAREPKAQTSVILLIEVIII